MNEKRVLVVERSGSDISYSNETVTNNLGKQEESIVLTGIFTTFNQKNRNGRIYESTDFLPHIESLKESIKNHTLLGELDHPHGFEISLTNASHVIESLEYDQQRNVVVGKIRLLNTAKGKDAQALVRDGIPLHISSRAAGTVDESGRVKLQQLFTYDLVADPGFANAVLSRVNEGVETRFSDNTRRILTEMKENYEHLNEGLTLISSIEGCEVYETNTELNPEPSKEGSNTDKFGYEQLNKNSKERAINGTIDDINNNNNMNNGNYISFEDFQKYTESLSEIIADLQSAISNYKTELDSVKKEKEGTKPTEAFEDGKTDNSLISTLVANNVDAKVAEVEEKYNNLKKYTLYLAEQLDNAISHQDYVVEESNKIAETQQNLIKHNNYIVEMLDKTIQHSDYITENLNDTIGYQNYIAEMLDKSIDYSNMLAEEQNKNIAHSSYLVEKMNQMVEHQDYIAENCNEIIDENNKLYETVNNLKAHNNYIVEGMNNLVAHNDYIVENINNMEGNKLNENNNKLVEQKLKNKEQKVVFNAKQYQQELNEKIGNLISTVKNQYEELKKKEVEHIEESRRALENSNEFKLVNYIPARLKEKWANLSNERKQEILSESKMFVINDVNSATYFWNTRDMRERKIEMKKIEEQVTAKKVEQTSVNEGLSDRLKLYSEMIKHNMRK